VALYHSRDAQSVAMLANPASGWVVVKSGVVLSVVVVLVYKLFRLYKLCRGFEWMGVRVYLQRILLTLLKLITAA